MKLETKRLIIIVLSLLFLASLILVQWLEVVRKKEEAGFEKPHISLPVQSRDCVECHRKESPGIVDHWMGSTHARKGVACLECHTADTDDADAFLHYNKTIATIVTPRDCARCHGDIAEEFSESHHAKGGNILASLDNFLAETVEGHRGVFNPHQPGGAQLVPEEVNGMASAFSGCQQCHGSKVAFRSEDGGMINVDDLQPDEDGKPTNKEALKKIVRDDEGKPQLHPSTWPNTGIGRLNMDGSRGSCTACHSRHDFSPRRARQPENCGKCHLGPDHPQKEIYEESKHGVAFRDLKEHMNLNADSWVLGEDYSHAPTCATCHMSGHSRNDGQITHDPGKRISWTNRPPISVRMDTNKDNEIVTETDLEKREELVDDTWQQKRARMQAVCTHCHTANYVSSFYQQYDDLVILFNEKFAKPGKQIVDALHAEGLLSKTQFDEEIEWTWFYLWHHEGRRARHGASMMAPDYTHWHGMFEVAERFYMELIPQARELIKHAEEEGKTEAAEAVRTVVDEILKRPEHSWFEEGAEDQMAKIKKSMQERYGQK